MNVTTPARKEKGKAMTFTIKTDEATKTRIIHLMKGYHCGKARQIKKRDLLAEVYGQGATRDESYNNLQDRKLRKMIEEINDEGGLICSDSSGYFWAASLDDGLDAAERNRARALTQLENANHLIENLKAEYGSQLGLFK